MTTNQGTTAITNKYGDVVQAGDMVNVLAFTAEGIEGGRVVEFYRKPTLGRIVVMAYVQQADGNVIRAEARYLIPRKVK